MYVWFPWVLVCVHYDLVEICIGSGCVCLEGCGQALSHRTYTFSLSWKKIFEASLNSSAVFKVWVIVPIASIEYPHTNYKYEFDALLVMFYKDGYKTITRLGTNYIYIYIIALNTWSVYLSLFSFTQCNTWSVTGTRTGAIVRTRVLQNIFIGRYFKLLRVLVKEYKVYIYKVWVFSFTLKHFDHFIFCVEYLYFCKDLG